MVDLAEQEDDLKKRIREYLVLMDFDFFGKFQIEITINRHDEFEHISRIETKIKSLEFDEYEATIRNISAPMAVIDPYGIAQKVFEIATNIEARINYLKKERTPFLKFLKSMTSIWKST